MTDYFVTANCGMRGRALIMFQVQSDFTCWEYFAALTTLFKDGQIKR